MSIKWSHDCAPRLTVNHILLYVIYTTRCLYTFLNSGKRKLLRETKQLWWLSFLIFIKIRFEKPYAIDSWQEAKQTSFEIWQKLRGEGDKNKAQNFQGGNPPAPNTANSVSKSGFYPDDIKKTVSKVCYFENIGKSW